MLNGIGGHTTVYIHSYSGLTFPPWLTEDRTNNTLYEKTLGCLIEITVLNLPYRAVHGLVYQPHYCLTARHARSLTYSCTSCTTSRANPSVGNSL